MSIPLTRSGNLPAGPPPRTNGTPHGYRNIRVLTPTPLHYRLVAYSGLSRCSLNEYILKVLDRAIPIDPWTGVPVPVGTQDPASCHRSGHDPSLAAQPGVIPSPEALTGSRLDQVLSGPVPTIDPAGSPLGRDQDDSDRGEQAHA